MLPYMMRRGTLLAFLVGALWLFPSCSGGDDMNDGGDGSEEAAVTDSAKDGPKSNAIDSAAE